MQAVFLLLPRPITTLMVQGAERWPLYAQALLGSNEFLYVD